MTDATMRAGARETVEVTTTKGHVILLDRDSFDGMPEGYFYVLGRYAWLKPKFRLHMNRIRVHRWVMGLEKGDDGIVDHINGNPLDNRRGNLRIVTKSLNALNKHVPYAGNATGYLGVTFDSRRASRPYRAAIMIDQKHRHIGTFATAEEAALAYKNAKEEIMRARGAEC